ncbi:MAG: hypothetical protein IKC71_04030 [Clostridia bacterium]|nr:hypothetical protein [Clostridia bacterium]
MDKFSIFKLINSLSSLLTEEVKKPLPIKESAPPEKNKESSFKNAYINSVKNHQDFVKRVQNKR